MTPRQCDGGHSSSQNARKSGRWDVHSNMDMDDDKCRKKMNGGVGYITTEISQKGTAWKREAQEKERGTWDARGVGDSSPRARGPFSLGP